MFANFETVCRLLSLFADFETVRFKLQKFKLQNQFKLQKSRQSERGKNGREQFRQPRRQSCCRQFCAGNAEFHPNAADSADKCGFLFLLNGSACRHKCERCDSRGTADFPESLYPAKEIALNRIKHYCDRHQHFRDRHFRIFDSDFLRNICKTAR